MPTGLPFVVRGWEPIVKHGGLYGAGVTYQCFSVGPFPAGTYLETVHAVVCRSATGRFWWTLGVGMNAVDDADGFAGTAAVFSAGPVQELGRPGFQLWSGNVSSVEYPIGVRLERGSMWLAVGFHNLDAASWYWNVSVRGVRVVGFRELAAAVGGEVADVSRVGGGVARA
jgi:hypothetical protein